MVCEYIQISVSPGGEVERIVLVAPGTRLVGEYSSMCHLKTRLGSEYIVYGV